MHDIEPYYRWRDHYIAAHDKRSPFYGREYDQFYFTNAVYNYVIHPQWDDFGSSTLYSKVLYAGYERRFAIIELIGEWNDCIANDIMFLKSNLIDSMLDEGINKFILICENVLNFHGSDDCYYEEWFHDIKEEGGWISLVNLLDHVENEMRDGQLDYFLHFGDRLNAFNWRASEPVHVLQRIENLLYNEQKRISMNYE